MTLSLCMIVKDEEEVIDRCLRSCRDLFDEIIIVDTGSCDKTKEIVKKYTDKIYDFKWIDDFSKARNYSFSKATSDYIMWLDADDVIEEKEYCKLKDLKNHLDNIDVVMLKYNIAFDTEGNPIFSYYRERILKRSKNFKWKDMVHEFLVIDGNIVKKDIAITHNKLKKENSNRNLKIYQKMEKEGITFSSRNYYYYGRELYDHKMYNECIEILTKFLLLEDGWIEDKIGACYLLYQVTSQEEYLFKTFSYDLPRKKTCCLIGNIYLGKKQYKQAIFWYELSLTLKVEENGFHEIQYDDFIPWINLCVCYYEIENYSKAKEYHNKCKQKYPNNELVLNNDIYFTKD